MLGETAHDLLYLRDQFPRRGVHDRKLLFDPQGVARAALLELYRHGVHVSTLGLRPRLSARGLARLRQAWRLVSFSRSGLALPSTTYRPRRQSVLHSERRIKTTG